VDEVEDLCFLAVRWGSVGECVSVSRALFVDDMLCS